MNNNQNINNTNNQNNDSVHNSNVFSDNTKAFDDSINSFGNNYTANTGLTGLFNLSIKSVNQQKNDSIEDNSKLENVVDNNNQVTQNATVNLGNSEITDTPKDVVVSEDDSKNRLNLEENVVRVVNDSHIVPVSFELMPVNTGKLNSTTVPINKDSNKKNKTRKLEKKYNENGDTYTRDNGYILINGRFISIVLFLTFIFVCFVVVKSFTFGKEVDKYEEFFVQIDKKMDEEAKVYAGEELDISSLKKVAASELVSCISTKLDVNDLPESVKKIISDIRDYYNQSYNNFAFAYRDIYTGFTVTYNENQEIFTASTIKAPTDIYIWEMISMGKIDLDNELTYMPYEYVAGSGLIQHNKKYSKYKTRELLRLSTVYSDNIAHNMLMDNYGRTNMLAFWKNLGTTAIFKQNSNWGVLNAHDALIYMSELYRFYNENDEYGNQVMTNFLNAFPKFIKGKNGYKVANKSGWTGSAIHDISIIFADNPYIVVALSNTGNGNYTAYFNKANDLAYNLHTEYWKYKMSLCEGIKQY